MKHGNHSVMRYLMLRGLFFPAKDKLKALIFGYEYLEGLTGSYGGRFWSTPKVISGRYCVDLYSMLISEVPLYTSADLWPKQEVQSEIWLPESILNLCCCSKYYGFQASRPWQPFDDVWIGGAQTTPNASSLHIPSPTPKVCSQIHFQQTDLTLSSSSSVSS